MSAKAAADTTVDPGVAMAVSSKAASRRPWRRADAPTAALHWLVAVLVLLSLGTGFRIAGDAPEAAWSRQVATLALQGEVIVWHIVSACALMAAAAGYVIFLVRARATGRVTLDAARMRGLRSPSRSVRWRSLNVVVYWLAFVLVLAAAVTGTLIYSGAATPSQSSTTALHRGIAWGLAGYIGLHVAVQVLAGGWRALLAMFVPRFAHGRAAALAFAAVCAAAAAVFVVDAVTVRPLTAARVADPPRLDGDPSDPAWQLARAVTVHTRGGANLPSGEAAVTVRAVHDGTYAYFLFEWPDATRSQKHHPLQKTSAGWRMLQKGYEREDESTYYEDKFAVMLARTSRFAALRTVHLGPRPLTDHPGSPGERGLHYTADGSMVDLWHWMSVRTNPLGQMEDGYFGPPHLPPDTPTERYAGGHSLDPARAGGSVRNWRGLLEGPAARRYDGAVVPRFLPQDPAVLVERLGRVNLDPATGDEGEWWLPADLAKPYTPALDANYPIGGIVPSIVLRGPIEGDRGDVAAAGTWSAGRWRLEARRRLDTGSTHDVAIGTGTYLWVAVFDHTQTRHSWHLRPLRIVMRQAD